MLDDVKLIVISGKRLRDRVAKMLPKGKFKEGDYGHIFWCDDMESQLQGVIDSNIDTYIVHNTEGQVIWNEHFYDCLIGDYNKHFVIISDSVNLDPRIEEHTLRMEQR